MTSAAQVDDERLLAIVLVGDLADESLEQVLQSNDSDVPAVLIGHDRDMRLRAHLEEQLLDRLRLRDVERRAGDRGDVDVLMAATQGDKQSFAYSTPRTSSIDSWNTGRREKPLLWIMAMASPTVAVSSSAATSVRGHHPPRGDILGKIGDGFRGAPLRPLRARLPRLLPRRETRGSPPRRERRLFGDDLDDPAPRHAEKSRDRPQDADRREREGAAVQADPLGVGDCDRARKRLGERVRDADADERAECPRGGQPKSPG